MVFREIKDVIKQEVLPREDELEKIEFELKDNYWTLQKNKNHKKKSIKEIGSRKKATEKYST
jgi:hypothetical protein